MIEHQVFKHYLPASMTAGNSETRVLLIGAGGNGCPMVFGLARMNYALRALGHSGLDITVMDPDTVDSGNVGRQLYSDADLGRNKAVVAVSRANLFFGMNWTALPMAFEKDHVSQLRDSEFSLVITAVDTVPARRLVQKAVSGKAIYFLDMGNGKRIGQCVLGTGTYMKQPAKMGSCIGHLPTVFDLYPKLEEDEKKEYQGPACGTIGDALEKQDLFINTAVTTFALQLLWEGFRTGTLTTHGVYVNLESKRTMPLAINPEVWRSMGWNPVVSLKRPGRTAKKPASKAA